MELEISKNYRIKNDIFSFKAGEVWSLVDEGYQAYFGEHNFVFVNAEKNCHFMVLRNTSDEDMEIGCHLDRYFEEIEEVAIGTIMPNVPQLVPVANAITLASRKRMTGRKPGWMLSATSVER